jgi:hypothetical protein
MGLASVVSEAFALPMPVGPQPRTESLPLHVVAELYNLRTRLAGMVHPPREVFLAQYDGAEPELFTTVEAARGYCDDLAPTDAYDKGWDWWVNEHGIHVQFWTHEDDDRPLSETSGLVTPLVVQGDDDLSELEALRVEVAALREERHSPNESVSLASEQMRADRDRIDGLESTNTALRARLAEVEGQRAALAERLRAGQTWRQGRLVSEDVVSQSELREVFGIPLAAPLDGITRLIAPLQALRETELAEDVSPQVAKLRDLLAGQRAAVEDPHDSPLHHSYRVPRDLPPLDGGQ